MKSSSLDIKLVTFDNPVELEPIMERVAECDPTFLLVDGYHLNQRFTWFDRFFEVFPLLKFDDQFDQVAYKSSKLVNQNVTGNADVFCLNITTTPVSR